LRKDGLSFEVKQAETRSEVFDALEKDSFDLILADCTLPNFSGRGALEIARALKPEVPFIFVSGTIGEETAIELLRNGATDYVLKDRLTRLAPAVRRALNEAEERSMRRQLQHRLREAGRLEAISTLSNGIAHDFNNILTIILGHATLLGMERDHPDRVLEIGETISQAARRGSEVVEQLMAFARKSEGHMTPTDLNRYVEARLERLRQRFSSDVEISFHPCANLPLILADAGQLERILMNLITNSVDFMPTGGRISLSTDLVRATERPDLLPQMTTESYVCLKVADTGVGMNSSTREQVFEPFYTTKERGRGTGLGLPVVYGLMQAHHGHIDVESEPGMGTTISLFFPVPQPGAVKTPPASKIADEARRGGETILIVEDESDVVFFLDSIFRNHGYQVISAQNCDEALSLFKAKQEKIDLVFSDVGLPRVDGIALCLKLKEMKPGLPIVLASGYPYKEFQARINELSPQAFLSKPYTMGDVLTTVRNALDDATASRTA
jgi:signal transduction histidine kinase